MECCESQTLCSFFFPLENLMHINEFQDNRDERIENFKIIGRNTRALLDAIQCMENNPNLLSKLLETCRLENSISDTEIKECLFRRTIKELADYTRQNYP